MNTPINILIVDDEPKNLTVLETVLDDPGYRLVRAESAEQALLALVVEEFALLILDIRMPGMTGFELAQMIKARKKTARVPIVFLTAYYNEDQHVLEGYGTGAVDYLHKPVNPAILRSKVAVFAELHRKQLECAANNHLLLAEVTERRRAGEQLRELNETLEQRVAERTETLATTNAALNASLQEKEVLLKEIHHRVKNNLQVISSILQMQSRAIDDPHYRAMFGECHDRVRTMALVHERLYRSPSLASIDLGEELRELAAMLAASYGRPSVRLTVEAGTTPVNIENAVPLGLVLSELVTNALKHAFPENRAGTVTVTLARPTPEQLRLSVRDDGRGLPEGFAWDKAKSLGLTVVNALARQLRATVEVRQERGTEIELTFPAPAPAAACLETRP